MNTLMPYQIRIDCQSTKTDINELVNYLCQAVLKLRDRNNQQQAIELLGTASAIPTCILIAEIITKNIPGLSQITSLNSENNKHDSETRSVGISIRLTYIPSETDMQEPGFQQKELDLFSQINWEDLYKFVMIYTNNLTMFKKKQRKTQGQNKNQINLKQSQILTQQTSSAIFNNNCDPRSFVYSQNLGLDNIDRSKIKTRGSQRR